MYSVLLARWTYTVRMQSAYRVHMLNNQMNAQLVARARKRMTPRMQRACRARSAHSTSIFVAFSLDMR